MGRYIGSFVFLDLRHAFCANLLFTAAGLYGTACYFHLPEAPKTLPGFVQTSKARFLQLPCENPSCLVKEFADTRHGVFPHRQALDMWRPS